jgi:dTDP-4-dehydrorhamnose reductase
MQTHIIGSTGYIGGKILGKLGEERIKKYSDIPAPDTTHIDLTDISTFDFSDFAEGDFAVFLSAISSPDECDQRYEQAYAINVTGTIRYIEELISRGVNVLFFSSDVVYGVNDGICDENTAPNPFGKYAEMKYEAERHFEGESGFKVFRLSYVFSETDKFMRYLIGCEKQDVQAEVFDGLYRNVIYIEDILSAVIALRGSFRGWDNQRFNLSGTDTLSREDLALMYRENVSEGLTYTVVTPESSFYEARPYKIATKSLYLESLLGHPQIKISDAMRLEFKENTHEK